jgi:hypothetical protein
VVFGADALNHRSHSSLGLSKPLERIEEIVMAALSTVRIVGLRALAQTASIFHTPHLKRRRLMDLSAIVTQVLITGGEIVLLLWLLAVLAFGLLIAVGFLQ